MLIRQTCRCLIFLWGIVTFIFRQIVYDGEVRHVHNICHIVALMNCYFKYDLGPMCNSFQNEIRVIFCNLYFLGFTTYHVEQKMSPTGLLFRITSKKISKPLSISTLLPKSKTNQMGKTQCSSEMVVSPHAQTTIHKAAKINSKRYYISLPFFHCL